MTIMEVASGRQLDIYLPDPGQICLEDIALGLSQECRFGRQCATFYSVAEHAVLVARKLMDEGYQKYAMAGLHHDDHKAYLGDLPVPLHQALHQDSPVWRCVEDGIQDACSSALGFDWPGDFARPEVAEANAWARALEAQRLMPSGGEGWEPARWALEAPSHWVGGLSPEAAKTLWLYWHNQLQLRQR